MANVRLSRQQVEVIGRLATQLRVGGQAVMVAGAAQNGKLRVHNLSVEYLTRITPEVAGNTIGVGQSVSVVHVRSLSAGNTIPLNQGTDTNQHMEDADNTLSISQEALVSHTLFVSAGNTLGIIQDVGLSVVRNLSVGNALILGQSVFKQETAESILTLGQEVSVSVVRYPSVGNTISLGQGIENNQHMEDADNTLSMSQDVTTTRTRFGTAISTLSLGQTLDVDVTLGVSSVLSLGQSVSVQKVLNRSVESDIGIDHEGWPSSHPFASNTIGVNQSVSVQKILSRSVGNTIDIQIATTPGSFRMTAGSVLTGWESRSYDAVSGYWNSVYTEMTSTASVVHVIGSRPTLLSAGNTLELGQSVSVSVVYNRAASNIINAKSTLGFVFIQDTTFCDYAPSVGSTTDPDAPEPPSVTPPTLAYTNNNIELSYPVTTPTEVLTLRGPELGNRERLSPHRINRETRGGTLTVYADPIWPQVKQLEFQFIGLTEIEGQDLLDFVTTSLGKEVKLRDWEGQEWLGVITSTEEPIVRNRDTCNLSASLSFELTSGG